MVNRIIDFVKNLINTKLRFYTFLLALLFSGLLPQIFAARSYQKSLQTHVVIEDMDFGQFDTIEGLQSLLNKHEEHSSLVEDSSDSKDNSEQSENNVLLFDSAQTIRLQRSFFTQPSLYSWVKDSMTRQSFPLDLQLQLKSKNGKIIRHYTLKTAKPFNWSIRVADAVAGGYFETVDFTVYGISTH